MAVVRTPRLLGRALAVVCLASAMLAPTGAVAGASGPRGLDYSCRLGATKLGAEITLTFRLRTDRAGDTWRVRLFHDDELVFSKIRVTNPEGNLKVVRAEPNLPGVDEFMGRARHTETGAVCVVETRI
jgi:hypothetical protein